MIGEHDTIQKANDDGEPSGTAGVPMLEVLEKARIERYGRRRDALFWRDQTRRRWIDPCIWPRNDGRDCSYGNGRKKTSSSDESNH